MSVAKLKSEAFDSPRNPQVRLCKSFVARGCRAVSDFVRKFGGWVEFGRGAGLKATMVLAPMRAAGVSEGEVSQVPRSASRIRDARAN